MQLFETIDRIHRIHKLIHREATGTPDEFAERLSLRRRQLYNILEEFKSYGANIQYSRSKSTFYYANDFEVLIEISVKPLKNDEKRTVFGGRLGQSFFSAIPLHNQAVYLSI